MTRDDFLPRPDETFQGWHERVCPDEHGLLNTVNAAGREGEVYRAARAEGRLSILFEALIRWPNVESASSLIRMLLAGEHTLNERRISAGAVRRFLAEVEKDAPDR
jgi:hypothetical protein